MGFSVVQPEVRFGQNDVPPMLYIIILCNLRTYNLAQASAVYVQKQFSLFLSFFLGLVYIKIELFY